MNLLSIFVSVSSFYALPPGLLSAVCYVESKHKEEVVHVKDGNSDSIGVCQIKYATAVDLGFKGTPEELKYSIVNIEYAGRYLKKMLVKYEDTSKAISAYNAGHPVSFNKKYVAKVYKAWKESKYAND